MLVSRPRWDRSRCNGNRVGSWVPAAHIGSQRGSLAAVGNGRVFSAAASAPLPRAVAATAVVLRKSRRVQTAEAGAEFNV